MSVLRCSPALQYGPVKALLPWSMRFFCSATYRRALRLLATWLAALLRGSTILTASSPPTLAAVRALSMHRFLWDTSLVA